MNLKGVKKVARELGLATAYRIRYGTKHKSEVAESFHRLYYDENVHHKTWKDTRWMGVPVQKCPFDLWVYQELIHATQPDLIVETGTFMGGSAYYFASLLDLLGKGDVLTIDVADLPTTLAGVNIKPERARPEHPRITYLCGSSTSPEIVKQVFERKPVSGNVLVVLDSDHRKDHVLQELHLYKALVPVGGYLVVEDSNINGHPVYESFGPGPMEAIDEWLGENRDFSPDRDLEKHLFSFNPRGYLRRT